MILEQADITITPGKQAEFDEAIQRGLATVISQAKGFRGFQVHKGIESPGRYLLTISAQDRAGNWLDKSREVFEEQTQRLMSAFEAGKDAMRDEIRKGSTPPRA